MYVLDFDKQTRRVHRLGYTRCLTNQKKTQHDSGGAVEMTPPTLVRIGCVQEQCALPRTNFT